MSELLRLNFVRDKAGIAIVNGDVYGIAGRKESLTVGAAGMPLDEAEINSLPDRYALDRHIKSFAPRKNEGVQPVGDDIVVDVVWDDAVRECDRASMFSWDGLFHASIETYTPNYDALLKMQNEFDEKESEVIAEKEMKIVKLINDCKSNLLIGRYERAVGYLIYNGAVGSHNDFGHKSYNDICTVAEFNQGIEEMAAAEWLNGYRRDYVRYKADCFAEGIDTSNKRLQKEATQPIYTKAMQDAGEMPRVGMMVEIVATPAFTQYREGYITYMGKQVGCYISAESGLEFSFAIDLVQINPIETRTPEEIEAEELEVAKKKQWDDISAELWRNGVMKYRSDIDPVIGYLQEKGYLA